MRLGAVLDPTWRRDKAFSPSKQPAMWETALPTPLQPAPALGSLGAQAASFHQVC